MLRPPLSPAPYAHATLGCAYNPVMEANVFWAAFGGGAAAGVVGVVGVLVVEYFRARRDRPGLDVTVSLGYEHGGYPDRSDVMMVFLSASNPRAIPLTIDSWGWGYGKGMMLLWAFVHSRQQLPYSLAPGTSTGASFPVDLTIAALRKNGLKPSDLKSGIVRTAIGRDFKGTIHKETMRTLQKAYDTTS